MDSDPCECDCSHSRGLQAKRGVHDPIGWRFAIQPSTIKATAGVFREECKRPHQRPLLESSTLASTNCQAADGHRHSKKNIDKSHQSFERPATSSARGARESLTLTTSPSVPGVARIWQPRRSRLICLRSHVRGGPAECQGRDLSDCRLEIDPSAAQVQTITGTP
jgi:hypothetical protein